MSDIAIRVENLGKLYRIGQRQRYKALRDILSEAIYAPFRAVRSFLRSHGTSQNSQTSNDFFWALKNVSFEVKHGEVIGVIGRNGAGKSTLLKILSRITEPTEGSAEIYGRVGSLLEVGTGFHPELTGRENVYLSGTILGMKKAEIDRKFDEIVAFAEIENFLDTQVKHYSSGMYVRLAFAVAAHLEPEILLVDEVLAVGDLSFQMKCLGKMGKVAKEGRTVVFVSHNMPAVRNLCSRALLLGEGRMEELGQAEDVIAKYLQKCASGLAASVTLPTTSNGEPGTGKFLRFCTSDGKPQAQFRLNEPWRIVLEFEIFRPLSHVIAAVGLVTMEMVPIVTYWSKPKELTAGSYCVEFECNLPLAGCDIQFAVGLSSYERPFYYVQRVGHVSISQVAAREQPLRAYGSGLLFTLQRSDIRPMMTSNNPAVF